MPRSRALNRKNSMERKTKISKMGPTTHTTGWPDAYFSVAFTHLQDIALYNRTTHHSAPRRKLNGGSISTSKEAPFCSAPKARRSSIATSKYNTRTKGAEGVKIPQQTICFRYDWYAVYSPQLSLRAQGKLPWWVWALQHGVHGLPLNTLMCCHVLNRAKIVQT